jgi:hypothetical protein
MLRNLTAKQFFEWEAFDSMDPIGDERFDLLIASVVAMIANVNRGKDQKAFTLQDATLKWDVEPKKGQNLEHQLAFVKAMAAAHNQMVTSGQRVKET